MGARCSCRLFARALRPASALEPIPLAGYTRRVGATESARLSLLGLRVSSSALLAGSLWVSAESADPQLPEVLISPDFILQPVPQTGPF